MVNEDLANRIKAEVDAQLAKRGLGELRYDFINWENELIFWFPADIGNKYEKPLSSVVKAVLSAFPKETTKQSGYVHDEPEEFDDDECNAPADDAPNPALVEINSALSALPRFPIDRYYESLDAGAPSIDIWVAPKFAAVTDEEAACERRDQERERLEAMADDVLFAEDDGEDGEGDFEWLPIPPPPKKLNTEVYLTMAYEPYDWIEKGEKTTEFREYCEYYVKKLLSQPLKTVRFQRGYGGPGHDEPRQMRWTVAGIEYYDINSRQSAPIDNPPAGFRPTHIAIDLGERIA